jgi:hypothetical protein
LAIKIYYTGNLVKVKEPQCLFKNLTQNKKVCRHRERLEAKSGVRYEDQTSIGP